MVTFLIRRGLTLVVTLLVVSVLAFLIPYAGEGDPARKILRARVNDPALDPAQVEALTKELGLDRPLFQQYLDWLREVLTGGFGYSFTNRTPVQELVVPALGVSVSLALAALLLTAAAGLADERVRPHLPVPLAMMAAVMAAPLAAEAQEYKAGKVTRVGMILTLAPEHPQMRAIIDPFRQALHEPPDLVAHPHVMAKGFCLTLGRGGVPWRVIKAAVNDPGAPGEDQTGLVGLVTDGHYDIEGKVLDGIQRFGLLA